MADIDSDIPHEPLTEKERRSDTILHFVTKVPRARERKCCLKNFIRKKKKKRFAPPIQTLHEELILTFTC